MASLFVSDLHLDESAPWAVEVFVGFLASQARAAHALYVLGDLFEAWIGDDALASAAPASPAHRVATALRELTTGGTACYLLHGNRDFLIGAEFARATGATLLPDPVVVDLNGHPTLLTHGDLLCTGDHAYQELRSIVRTSDWQRRFLQLPLATRMMLANEARAGSRAHTQRVAPVIMDVDAQAVTAAFRASNTRRMIHGHTHRPGAHTHVVSGETAERHVLDAWYERGSYLKVEGPRATAVPLPRT
jgi:UDP-2,3-diacylglucosamine hydrolase